MRIPRAMLFMLLVLGLALTQRASAQDAQSRLWDAAIAGDTATIRKAVSEGARVDSLDTRTSRNGRYALNWATLNNRVDAVKLLLELKAPIEAENLTGFTALHHAAEGGSLDAARILVAAGANPLHTNKVGFKPADIATERGHNEIVALLDEAARKLPKK